MSSDVVLEARGLKKHYPVRGGLFLRARGSVRAVDGVDLKLRKGGTVGLVGESGCGKSTFARLVLALERPDEGELLFGGKAVEDERTFRRSVQGIFQDPYGTLDPRFTIARCLEEGLRNLLPSVSGPGRRERIRAALDAVGLSEAILERFPHEFSGGQRQRIGIARALVLEPSVLICDEPVSSLDVSVAAQIIMLLRKLKEERELTVVIISHHMGLVSALADEIAVMHAGRLVETGPTDKIINEPQHSYTKELMRAVPRLEGVEQ